MTNFTSKPRLKIPKLLRPTIAGLQGSGSVSEYPALAKRKPPTPYPPSPFRVLRIQFVSPFSSASLSIAFSRFPSSSVKATCVSCRSEEKAAVEDEVVETFWRLDGGASEVAACDCGTEGTEAAARCMNWKAQA